MKNSSLQVFTKSILLLILSAFFGSCQKINTTELRDNQLKIVSVKGGTKFGECWKDCNQEIVITSDKASFSLTSNDKKYSDKKLESKISESEWKSILSLIDIVSIRELPNISGCPDCSDGGAEWVEINFNNGTTEKKIYNFLSSPQQIRALAEKLAAIREDNVALLKRKNSNEKFENRFQLYSFGKEIN